MRNYVKWSDRHGVKPISSAQRKGYFKWTPEAERELAILATYMCDAQIAAAFTTDLVRVSRRAVRQHRAALGIPCQVFAPRAKRKVKPEIVTARAYRLDINRERTVARMLALAAKCTRRVAA